MTRSIFPFNLSTGEEATEVFIIGMEDPLKVSVVLPSCFRSVFIELSSPPGPSSPTFITGGSLMGGGPGFQ
jgi:hypothetical protein